MFINEANKQILRKNSSFSNILQKNAKKTNNIVKLNRSVTPRNSSRINPETKQIKGNSLIDFRNQKLSNKIMLSILYIYLDTSADESKKYS